VALTHGEALEEPVCRWSFAPTRHASCPSDGRGVVTPDGGLGAFHRVVPDGRLQDTFLEDDARHFPIRICEVPVGIGRGDDGGGYVLGPRDSPCEWVQGLTVTEPHTSGPEGASITASDGRGLRNYFGDPVS
jgi:hypothetical protein